jgi:cell shape-determining protein MreC
MQNRLKHLIRTEKVKYRMKFRRKTSDKTIEQIKRIAEHWGSLEMLSAVTAIDNLVHDVKGLDAERAELYRMIENREKRLKIHRADYRQAQRDIKKLKHQNAALKKKLALFSDYHLPPKKRKPPKKATA